MIGGAMVTPRGYRRKEDTAMPKLCVFAGTTEGREIAEFLADAALRT